MIAMTPLAIAMDRTVIAIRIQNGLNRASRRHLASEVLHAVHDVEEGRHREAARPTFSVPLMSTSRRELRGFPLYLPAVAARMHSTAARTRNSVDAHTRTAYHEAGHGVLSAAINDRPHHLGIRASHGTLGRTGLKLFARPASLTQVYLAGFAAEHILTGRRPRPCDIETELGILAHTDPALVATFEGIEASDGYGAVLHLLREGVRASEEELRREVERSYEIARASVAAVWSTVKAIADALLMHKKLDRDRIDEVIGDADLSTPVLAVQRAHGVTAK